MTRISCLLLCLVVLFDTGHAILCYSCQATNATLCSKGRTQLREVDCGLENPKFYRFCLYKEVYDRETDEVTYSHGCELIGKPAIFREIPQCTYEDPRYRVQLCKLCFKDLCTFQAATPVTNTHFLILLCLSATYLFKVLLQD